MFDGDPPREVRAALSRYWFVTTESPGFSGGIGVYTHHAARMFAEHGVAVTVLCHDPQAHDPACSFSDGYRTIRFAQRGLDRRPIPHANLQGPLRLAREAGEMVRTLIEAEGAPDVVEFQDYGALAHGFLKHRLMHPEVVWPKVVLTAHRPHLHCLISDDDSPHEHSAAFLADAERWCYAAADAVFAPCRFILEPLAQLGFPLDRAEVVHNPYGAGQLDSLAPSPHLAPEALELSRRRHTAAEPLLFFGKLQRQKGAVDLLAALDALNTEGGAPPLWLFGRDAFLSGAAGTTYDGLEQRHRRLFASGRVRYFGGYGAADLRALCQAHPVALLPYREDCLPYAFIETVLCGAIPLTNANGGQRELIAPELHDLLTADVTQPDAWAAKARALLALNAADRAALSRRLQAQVRAATDPEAVFARKSALLREVRPTYRTAVYPFVHADARRFEGPDPLRRIALAAGVSQRGVTRGVRRAGPEVEPSPELVSVVVPYFDMHDFVDETLASIEAQDHAAVEIVLVDDGSRSPEAAAKLDALLSAPRRFPLRVLRKTNGGLADARNAGAKIAHGDYLYFLDADDVIHPSTFSRSLRVLQRFRNVGYVGAALKEFGESDGEWSVFDIDGPYIGFHNLQICAFLIRAEAWLEHGVNDPAMSLGMEDYESHVRLFCAGVRGIALPETLFSYRKRPGSMSKAFDAHGVAYLYRRMWRNNAELLRRFGPELIGLYAENGHGALAPSVGQPTPAHLALFRRDIPALEEIAEDLEAHASRERLGRALRARCAVGGAEWDYTAARLLMALDLEPAFARNLLRAAAREAVGNGWFRLYAMLAELRDGRIGAAEALWSDAFTSFCRAEAGPIGWIAALEAARGFPHVAEAMRSWLEAKAAIVIGPAPSHLGTEPTQPSGDFAPLHLALEALRTAKGFDIAPAEAAVRAAATGQLSAEATDALLARWRRTWASRFNTHDARDPVFWGRTADAYLGAGASRTPVRDPLEAADRERWLALHPAAALAGRGAALARRIGRRALAVVEG